MEISETCMIFREESIFDQHGIPKLDPGPIFKKSAGRRWHVGGTRLPNLVKNMLILMRSMLMGIF